jgi:hypothetical protein
VKDAAATAGPPFVVVKVLTNGVSHVPRTLRATSERRNSRWVSESASEVDLSILWIVIVEILVLAGARKGGRASRLAQRLNGQTHRPTKEA